MFSEVGKARQVNVSKGAFIGLLSFLLVLNLGWKLRQVFSYAPDLGGFERNVIWGIQQVMEGKPLYSHPEKGNFAIVQYMPAYYYLVGAAGKILFVDPSNAHSVYSLARGLNLVFTLIASVLVFFLARNPFKVSGLVAFSVASLGFLLMESFSISGRPDSLKALLFVLLLFSLTRENLRNRYRFGWAILLSTLAFFTKQDGLVFSAILPFSLFWARQWKSFFVVSIAQGVLIGSCLAGFQVFSGGNFLLNVLGGLQNGISLSWFVGAFGNYFAWLAVLFSVALVLSLEFLLEQDSRLHILAFGFCFSFFPQLLFSLKYGSGPNYFLECTLISLVLLGIFLSSSQKTNLWARPFSGYLVALVWVGLFFLTTVFRWTTGIFLHQEPELKNKYNRQKSVVEYLKSEGGGSEPNTLVLIGRQWEDHLTTLLSGSVICPMRDVSRQVYDAGFEERFQRLKKMSERGEIRFIVTDQSSLPEFLGNQFEVYHKKAEIGGYHIFKAKP